MIDALNGGYTQEASGMCTIKLAPGFDQQSICLDKFTAEKCQAFSTTCEYSAATWSQTYGKQDKADEMRRAQALCKKSVAESVGGALAADASAGLRLEGLRLRSIPSPSTSGPIAGKTPVPLKMPSAAARAPLEELTAIPISSSVPFTGEMTPGSVPAASYRRRLFAVAATKGAVNAAVAAAAAAAKLKKAPPSNFTFVAGKECAATAVKSMKPRKPTIALRMGPYTPKVVEQLRQPSARGHGIVKPASMSANGTTAMAEVAAAHTITTTMPAYSVTN